MLRVLGIGVALLAVLAVACGDDDDEATAAPELTADAASPYEAQVRAITSRVAGEVDERAEALEEAASLGSETTLLRRIEEIVPQIIAARSGAIDEFVDLAVPEQYTADHARYLDGTRQRVALLEQILGAATDSDLVRISELLEEIGVVERETVNALAAEFVAIAFTAESTALLASLASGLDAEQQAYVEELRQGALEFQRRAQAFGSAFAQAYPTAERLLSALADAGAGEAMAAAYDVIVEIEPPASMAEDHALVVSYYEEAVRIDRLIGEATRSGDAAAFLINNALLQYAAAPVMFEVSPAVCNVLFSPALCATGVDVPEDAYERELRFAIRELAARFGPAGPWDTFGLLPAGSQAATAAAALELGPAAIATVREVRDRVAAVQPSDALGADHQALVAYLDAVLAQQQDIVASADRADTEGVRAGIAATAQALCEASTALSRRARPAVGFYFGPEPGRTPVPGLCASA